MSHNINIIIFQKHLTQTMKELKKLLQHKKYMLRFLIVKIIFEGIINKEISHLKVLKTNFLNNKPNCV